MIKTFDDKLNCIVKQFSEPQEIAQRSRDLAMAMPRNCRTWERLQDSWTGRTFRDWDHLLKVCAQPRPSDVKMVEEFTTLLAGKIPAPRAVRRVRRLNEDQGEIDCDRALQGEPAFYRDTVRMPRPSTMAITLLVNMSVSASTDETEAFWKCAAIIATADLLEQAGYSVQITMYEYSHDIRGGKYSNDFLICPIKNAGENLVISTTCATMSTWFMRNIVFTSYHGDGEVDSSYGMPQKSVDAWRPFAEYFDADGSLVMPMPAVISRDEAIREATRILAEIDNACHA